MNHTRARTRIRVALVTADAGRRASLDRALGGAADVEVLGWADALEPLVVLGTRADVCLCTDAPPAEAAARLRDLGVHVVLDRGDPLAAVRQAGSADPPVDADAVSRPQLSARQRDVLTAYVSSSDLLPTVARRLGMDPETMKTHLRRIRAKYSGAGRPAPTRRDLYVRAVEDGLLPPPSGPSDR